MKLVKKGYYLLLFYIKRFPKAWASLAGLIMVLFIIVAALLPLYHKINLKKELYADLLTTLPKEQVPTVMSSDYDRLLTSETTYVEGLRKHFFSTNDATLFLVTILGKWCDDLSLTMKKLVQLDDVSFLKEDSLIPVELHVQGTYVNMKQLLLDLKSFENDIFLSHLDIVRIDDKLTSLYMTLHLSIPVRGDRL